MPVCPRRIIGWPYAVEPCFSPGEDPGGWIIEESPAASCGIAKATAARRRIHSSRALLRGCMPAPGNNASVSVRRPVAGQAPVRSRSARAPAKSRTMSAELGTGSELPGALPREATSARQFAACPEFSLDFLTYLPTFPLCSQIETLIRKDRCHISKRRRR